MERHVARQPGDRRLEDVGHEPGDKQDDGRARERIGDPGTQDADDPDEDDDDEPEQQPQLARRDHSRECPALGPVGVHHHPPTTTPGTAGPVSSSGPGLSRGSGTTTSRASMVCRTARHVVAITPATGTTRNIPTMPASAFPIGTAKRTIAGCRLTALP